MTQTGKMSQGEIGKGNRKQDPDLRLGLWIENPSPKHKARSADRGPQGHREKIEAAV